MIKLFQIILNWIVTKLNPPLHHPPSKDDPAQTRQLAFPPVTATPTELLTAPNASDDAPTIKLRNQSDDSEDVLSTESITTVAEPEDASFTEPTAVLEKNEDASTLDVARNIVGTVDGHVPDCSQLYCIAHNPYNHLMLASAGTGKTTTIIGKIKYLLLTEQYAPEDILILTHNRYSADEMRSHIVRETGKDVYIGTFHKLGMDILRQSYPGISVITDTEKTQLIRNLVYSSLHSPNYSRILLSYANYSNRTFLVPDYVLGAQSTLHTNDVDAILLQNESFMETFYIDCLKAIDRLRTINKTPEYLREKWKSYYAQTTFCDAITPIFYGYSQHLRSNGIIDFSDMINHATELIKSGSYHSHFRYVAVDEYQDISQSRLDFLIALRQSCDYSLFCAGDDWQSIFSFSGSNLDYTILFARYWGSASVSQLHVVHRFPQNLVELSSTFIMHNSAQIQKNIFGNNQSQNQTVFEISKHNQNELVEALSSILQKMPEKKSVFLIGRYKQDLDPYLNVFQPIAEEYKDSSFIKLEYSTRHDLDITFMTAHKSKGMESDFVLILNNLGGIKQTNHRGFPASFRNFSIVDSLFESSESARQNEERRLYYVALTRARERVFLFTLEDRESVFIHELRRSYGIALSPDHHSTCPLCGHLLNRTNDPYSPLMYCSYCRYSRVLYPNDLPF